MKFINEEILGNDTSVMFPAKFVADSTISEVFTECLKGKMPKVMASALLTTVSKNLHSALFDYATGNLVISDESESDCVITETKSGSLFHVIKTSEDNFSVECCMVTKATLNGQEVISSQKMPIAEKENVFKASILGVMNLMYKTDLTALKKICGKELNEASNWTKDEVMNFMKGTTPVKYSLSYDYSIEYGTDESFFPLFGQEKQKKASEKSTAKKALTFKFKEKDGYYIPDPKYFFNDKCKGSNIKLPTKIKISDLAKDLYKRIVYEGSLKPFRNFILKGVAGTGKTQVVYQLAFMLGIPYYCFSFNANTEAGDLLGGILPVLQPDGSTAFQFIESPIVTWAREPYAILEAQEFNTPRQAGAIVALNSMLCERRMYLSNGETVELSEDHVFIGTMNENYEGTKDLNQSFISRMDLVIKVDDLTPKDMVKRVIDYTSIPEALLEKMGACIINCARYIEKEDSLGVASFREFQSWVSEVDFIVGDGVPTVETIKKASKSTVYNKLSQIDDNLSFNEFSNSLLSPLN